MKKSLGTAAILFTLIFVLLIVALPSLTSAAQNSPQLIVINKATNQLAYFNNGELVQTFAVGTGRSDALTPEGTFNIVNKIKNRPYYKDGIPGGDPSNPLGDRWLGLDARGTAGTTYAIHGNSNHNSIGKYVSAGCVRMYNDEVRWLFDEIKLNTTVIIGHFKNFEEAAKQAGYSLQPPIKVFINDEPLLLEYPPINQDQRILVPLRAIFSSLGAKVAYDSKTKSITAVKAELETRLTVDSKKALINGVETTLEVPAKIINGQTYVPVRFVTEALGSKLNWNQETRTIDIFIEGSYQLGESLPSDTINLLLNGNLNPLEQLSFLKDGKSLVPLRGLFQELGAIVFWFEETETIIVQKDTTIIELKIGGDNAFLNGEPLLLDVPAQFRNGSTYVPARFVSEAIGTQVRWHPATKTIEIFTEK